MKTSQVLRAFVVILMSLFILFTLTGPGGSFRASAKRSPYIYICINHHWAYAYEWPLGSILTLTIDDPATSKPIDFSATATAVEDPLQNVQSDAWFDLRRAHLEPGMIVKVTDGHLTKSLTLAKISVDGWDLLTNTIWGTGTPGAFVNVFNHAVVGKDSRTVVVDQSGNWTAYPFNPNSFDLTEDSYGYVIEEDVDGDTNRLDFDVLRPYYWKVSVFPETNFVQLGDVFFDEVYTLTIARSTNPNQTVFSVVGILDETWGVVNFPMKGFDIQVGDVVTISDGTVFSVLTVAPPGTINLDVDSDVASGTARPSKQVYVAACGWRYTQADDRGQWAVSFHNAGQTLYDSASDPCDVQPGTSGDFGETIPEDMTNYHWQIPDITAIQVTDNPIRQDQNAMVSFSFNNPAWDLGVTPEKPMGNQGLKIIWDWGDGATTEDTHPSIPTVRAGHQYSQPGLYTITVTIYLDSGRVSETEHFRNLIVSGSNTGFAFADGWFASPNGASPTNPELTGNANLWFIYINSKIINAPFVEVLFKLGSLDFASKSVEWAVVDDGKLNLKGSGMVNGHVGYGFLLAAGDRRASSDRAKGAIRMKIWNMDTSQVIYDNQPGADDFTDPITMLNSGAIYIR